MRASVSVLALTLAALAGASLAAAQGKASTPPATMLMSPVAIPVIIDRQMANFIYLTVRLTLSAKADPQKLRNMEPFFRDALLKDSYHTPLQSAADPNMINEPALRSLVLREAVTLVGPGMVTGVQVIRVQPQRFISKPRPAAAR